MFLLIFFTASVTPLLLHGHRSHPAAPAASERLAADGSEAVGSTPEEFGAHIKSEMLKWGQVVKAAGITAD